MQQSETRINQGVDDQVAVNLKRMDADLTPRGSGVCSSPQDCMVKFAARELVDRSWDLR